LEAGLFNEAIDSMMLQELPLLDRCFTWSNHQDPPILVKLDRFFIDSDWASLLPNSMVTSLSSATSDHCILCLPAATSIPKPSIFHFHKHWLRLPGCKDVISRAWSSVWGRSGSARISLCMKCCCADLKV
jgi:hypothetical protein